MTGTEYSRVLRKLADIVDKIVAGEKHPHCQNMPIVTQPEVLVGAALLWGYLRDLFTVTPKESFSRGELLVLLDTISRDTEMFPGGFVQQIAELEYEQSITAEELEMDESDDG